MGLPRLVVLEHLLLLLISAVSFFAIFMLNDWMLQWLEHSEHVNWIFLPAGVRLLLVLVMGFPGAAGIVLGTWAVSLQDGQSWSLLMVGNGLISGLVPWMVLRWGWSCFHSLAGLKPDTLFGLVLSYAMLNALMHHLFWWCIQQSPPSVLTGLTAMAVGDVVGALLLLYLLKWGLDRWSLPSLNPH